ncbi:MAG: hypothetical protein CL931_16595, partial [Deltaproteobacteria bacterium]|nr:hypothetical protein [Deltaproteobacteria bacterium]
TDNAAAEAAAAAAAGSAACTQAGGTWDAGTSTCTPAYNCFVGGFCAQVADYFPPGLISDSNTYRGHHQSVDPALAAGCMTYPGPGTAWDGGREAAVRLSAASGIIIGVATLGDIVMAVCQ